MCVPAFGGTHFVELKPRGHDKVLQLLQKGVQIPNPLTIDIGAEVAIERISGTDVQIYPGCRLYGAGTLICAGARLGRDGPVTVENCCVGPQVHLDSGTFSGSVFLEKSSMGPNAHVREGCLLEEESGGAHCVGLKQTILFPFVTLGSLINFCDCLMAGGTSRKNHSEVGSSYIHFNFTPDGDKTTPSLIGDVPRGVMLNQPPIFLGGQGGMVGPLRIGFGNVTIAGTVVRKDCLKEHRLIVGKTFPEASMLYATGTYGGLKRMVRNNLVYLASLAALDAWYRQVRSRFFAAQEFGAELLEGACTLLTRARQERVKRLLSMAVKAGAAAGQGRAGQEKQEVCAGMEAACAVFTEPLPGDVAVSQRDSFLDAFARHCQEIGPAAYVETVQRMPARLSAAGTTWLEAVIDECCCRAGGFFPSLGLFQAAN